MGWINERAMKTGVNLRSDPARQRKGPLRRIMRDVRSSEGMFARARVELECGHIVSSDGMYQARCSACSENLMTGGFER